MSKNLNLTKEQAEVLEAKGCDILVAASAGSGKTFVVVERILNRIVNDYIDIDKILVVTFTNAAASELKERILNKFYDFLKDKEVEEEKKRHIEKQIKLINRTQISTIHSFCLNIIKNNFYLLQIDPNVKTLDENKAKLMLIESIDTVIEDEYEKKSEEFIKALEIFKNEENLIDYLEKTYNFSKSMVDPNEWLENSAKRYLLSNKDIYDLSEIEFGNEIIMSVKEKLEVLQRELEKVCNKISLDKDFESRLTILENMLEKVEALKLLNKFDDMYEFLVKLPDFPRLPSSKCANEDLKREVSDIKKKVVDELDSISKIIYMDTNGILNELNSMYPIINWIVNTVKSIDIIYTEKKRVTSQIDFNDYEHLALKVLQNEDVAKKYQDKFEEIYIDEYQDTSYIQEVLLKTISKDNRIMVGDVKQSIYSFRNAEPNLFNEKYNKYDIYGSKGETLGKKILLSKNFRSRKCVLDSINDVFKRVMSEEVGECDYSKNEYLDYGEGFDLETEAENLTEINIIETEVEENANVYEEEIVDITKTEKEAYAIANKINEMIQSDKKIYDLKEKEYRKIRYGDIAILLRSTTNKANVYEEVLKSKGIPAFSDVSESFYTGQEIGLVLSLLKTIDNIYDDISLVSCMYSIIGKFTLDDLVYIRSEEKKDYFYNAVLKIYNNGENEEKDIYMKIKNFLQLLDKIKLSLSTYSIAETLLYIYKETGIYDSFYLEKMGKQKCANLESLVEIAKKFEKEEKSSLYKFIKYIESMKERKSKGGDSPKLIGEGENVVRILTIHKSKGLEYPIVFLANASKKYNIRDMNEDLIYDKVMGIGIDIYDNSKAIMYPSIIKQAIKEKIKNRTISEEERLLYVAMTRAKEKLFIYGSVSNYQKLKDRMTFITYDEKLPLIAVKGVNNYLGLMLLAQNFENSNNCTINVVDSNYNKIEKSLNKEVLINREYNAKDAFLALCSKNNLETRMINPLFKTKYNYEEILMIKKKYAATELKNESLVQDVLMKYSDTDKNEILELTPKVIKDSSNLNYGTMIHEILEKIDYDNFNCDKVYHIIEKTFGASNEKLLKYVKHKILTYISDQNVKKYLQEAKVIKKEQPFVIYDRLDNIEDVALKDKTYIQGIIDLFVITKDNQRIIIDFKTDKIDDEVELIKRYKTQLEIYKRGVELSCKEKVNGLFIYSFNLEKLIKVE